MIRGPRRSDQGFIASTWVKSITRGTHFNERHGTMRTPFDINEKVSMTLDRPDTRALLYVKPHDPDTILGWVLYVDGTKVPTVHFCYVRADHRGGHRIVGELLHRIDVHPDLPVICTSEGPSSQMMRTMYPAATHTPLATFLKPKPNG